MPPKGIDYSKWDKLQYSSSENDDDDDNGEYDDYDDQQQQQQQQEVNATATDDTTTLQQDQQKIRPSIQKFDKPTAITIGSSSTTDQTKTSNETTRNVITSSSSSSNSQIIELPTKKEAKEREKEKETEKHRDIVKVTPPTSDNNNNNILKKSKYLRNGCYFIRKEGEQEEQEKQEGTQQGMFWSQTADTVTLGVIIESFTMSDFLEISDDDLGIDEAVRKWNSDKKKRRKVTNVDVMSSLPSTKKNKNNNNKCCKVTISTDDGDRIKSITLAYDARPVDPDMLWNVEVLSATDLGLMMNDNNSNDNNDTTNTKLTPETLLAARCVLVELKKMLPGDINPYSSSNNNNNSDDELRDPNDDQTSSSLLQSAASTGLKHWWDHLLENGQGKIDLEKDLVYDCYTSSSGSGDSDEKQKNNEEALKKKREKAEKMKEVWEEAHRMFKDRIQERREKEIEKFGETLDGKKLS